MTAWGLLCADWETNLSYLLANAYSPKFGITLDNSEPLCMSMLTWQLHQHIMHFPLAYCSDGESFKTITLWILHRIKIEC